MKILHTADWHLGATLYGASRIAEHKAFFKWFVKMANEEEVNAVIVAGDIFEHAQASATANRLFYEVITKLKEIPSLSQIIIIAGNHDSGARLEAPKKLLDGIGIHIVGVFGEPADHLIPIGPAKAPVGVVAAVPFVHEYLLGLRSFGEAKQNIYEIRESLNSRFRALYDNLAEKAAEKYPDLPLIATGHLTLQGSISSEDRAQIHLSRLIKGLSPQIFSKKFRYVALGHIHEALSFEDRIAYSGSPIPISRAERSAKQYVNLVTISPEDTEIIRLETPTTRQILDLKGTQEEVEKAIQKLQWNTPLPPFLYLVVEVDFFRADLSSFFSELLKKHHSSAEIRLLRVEQMLTSATKEVKKHELLATPLHELSPQEVFTRLYQLKHDHIPSEAIVTRFTSLMNDDIRE